MNDNIIEIYNLTKKFKTVTAVDNINLKVKKGEMLGIVGPDGAGKTTAIKLLCGITIPDNSTGRMLQYDFIKEKEKIKNHIGYLSQKFSLYTDLTVDENIEFFAEIHRVADYKTKRNELLQFTRLLDFRKRLAGKLSGGMKQKLALACTLIHTPDIIFLDEPTTGVDPVSRRDFWKILFDLLKKGITIILTTPYLDEAERCSRISMMHNGKFLIIDSFKNIKKQMKGFIFEVVTAQIRKTYKILSDISAIDEVQTFGDRVNILIQKKELIEKVKKALKSEKIKIISVNEISPSLENIFISLIKENLKKEKK
ncbi:MAG: ABC transporter ATP-binding protein [Spirochaetes bacterium]|nr:ABC transporter ATP-binding protein [Spirochaetota bacterium]